MPIRKQIQYAQQIKLFEAGKPYKGKRYWFRLEQDKTLLWQVFYGMTKELCKISTCTVCSKNPAYRYLAEKFMQDEGCKKDTFF